MVAEPWATNAVGRADRKSSETFEPPKPKVFDSTFVIVIGRGVCGM